MGTNMVRGTFKNAGRKLIAGVLPFAAAVALVGVAAPAQAAPVQAPAPVVQQVAEPVRVVAAGTGISLEEIATNPEAKNSDPLANGAAAGAAAGAAGSGVLAAASCLPGFLVLAVPCGIAGAINGAIIGTVVGLLVGAIAPESVPQVLP
ncbi:hypothetical protein [Nocardia amikacinitolerans]|uniref:hypothetical protein n=1 Tax=Nocardia amikacinitolerans TaxID=756689 RepID=UPI0008362278|nr:hypothetical protein [Nocardia amikacinitolerans]